MGCLVQLLVLRHWPDDALFKPGQESLDWLASCCGLSIDVENVGSTPRAIAFSESGDGAVVQQLDPFDGPVDTITVANSEAGEALVFFIPQGYLLPGLLLEALQSLMEVSNSFRVLILFLMVDPVLLLDGLDEGLGEAVESNRVVDVECYDPPPFFSSPSTVTYTPAVPAPAAPAPVPASAPPQHVYHPPAPAPSHPTTDHSRHHLPQPMEDQ